MYLVPTGSSLIAVSLSLGLDFGMPLDLRQCYSRFSMTTLLSNGNVNLLERAAVGVLPSNKQDNGGWNGGNSVRSSCAQNDFNEHLKRELIVLPTCVQAVCA